MNIKILWFDDDMNKLSSHINYLRHKKIDVLLATSLIEALDICDKQLIQFDCIIVDIRVLHELDKNAGILFIGKLLEKYKFKKPIIVFTVLNRNNDAKLFDLLKKSNIFYFQKGVTVTKFYETFKAIMEKNGN